MQSEPFSSSLEENLALPLVDALFKRRSRRFSHGTVIADGPLAFTFRNPPLRLTQLEQLVVLSAAAGNTGWHFLHPHGTRSTSCLPSFVARASGRTVSSMAPWHSTERFFAVDATGRRFRSGIKLWPLSVLEQEMLTGAAADQPMMGFAGKLELPAMGLGGWIYNGMDRLAVLGGGGDPGVPGLDFHAAQDERWPVLNPTGRFGVVPAHSPPFPGHARWRGGLS